MTGTEPSLVGALLDRRYRVDRLLARGGMSSVYRGLDTRLDRPVAIKIMDSRFADDRAFVERFEREARSAARLHHPHVVAVHDQGFDAAPGSEDRRAFLVMELVDGGTLRDLLDQRGALDVPLALAVAEHVLAALGAAHAAGLVHRDVKPENVLIGRGGPAGGGVVKVGDFGLVRAVASAGTTSNSVILGTVAYLSPEQVTTGAASERGDVYSAGILLYEMLTGSVPYTADTALSVAYRHVNDDVPRPSRDRADLPPALDDLVLRATRRDAQARPADAGAFLAELAEVRTQLGIARTPIPVPVLPATESGLPDADDQDTQETADTRSGDRTVPAMRPVTPPAGTAGPRGTQALPRGPLAPAGASQPQPAPVEPGPVAEEPAPRRRGVLALWIAVVVLVVAGVGAGVWWFTAGRWVDIPKVTGMERAKAEQTLRAAELTPEFTERRHNSVPSGSVIATDPTAGESALAGADVSVVVSLGKPIVPDIRPGTSVRQAQQAIRGVQLEPKRNRDADRYSDSVPEGAVVSVSPKPGSEANLGDRVTIVVSKGPPPTPIPSVKGQSRDQAFQTLSAAGFEPFDAGEEFAADVPSGSVTRTDPAEGAAPTDSPRVGVYVSNAVAVPQVSGMPIDQALQALADAGLTSDAEDRRGAFAFVIGQQQSAGTLVEKGTTIKLSVVP